MCAFDSATSKGMVLYRTVEGIVGTVSTGNVARKVSLNTRSRDLYLVPLQMSVLIVCLVHKLKRVPVVTRPDHDSWLLCRLVHVESIKVTKI